MNYPIYLDYNATTPCDPRVVEAMLPYFTRDFGNAASRSHAYGWVAEEAVDMAREQVAALVGCEKGEIIFTSGATEAVNLAIRGMYEMYQVKGKHIVTSQTEHKAVLDTCAQLERMGADVTYLPVKNDGSIEWQDVQHAIRPDTIFISIMYANNETGVIMPVKELGAMAKKNGVFFFCDATQAAGKIKLNVLDDGVDAMAFSAHKIYGPKGVGALYLRRKEPRVRLTPMQYGGGHEKGLRSGTLNVPGIVGFGKACELAGKELEQNQQKISGLRDALLHAVLDIPGSQLNGNPDHLLPNTCNISFHGVSSQALLAKINRLVAASSGSACTSATLEPSYVLVAMGLGDERASQSIRFSLGHMTTETEIRNCIEILRSALKDH